MPPTASIEAYLPNTSLEVVETVAETKPMIEQVRDLFLAEYEKDPEAFAIEDVDHIRNSDWYVTRFLLRKNRDVKQAAKMICDSMRWRKEMQIPFMKDEVFPKEFWQIGAAFRYEPDRWGNAVIYLRVHMHRRIPELQDAIKKFVIHVMNQTDVAVDGRGMAIVFDCSGAGIQNADMDLLWFLIATMRNYYPSGLSYILVYELPWILKSCWSLAKGWVPEADRKLIKFAGKKDITKFIPAENLPYYMGGTCKRSFRAIPEGCPTAEEAAEQHGFDVKDLVRLRKMFAPYLDGAEAEPEP